MAFQKGESGNPAGRVAGKTPAGKLRKIIEAKAGDILEALITQALLGDVGACKALLDKVIPSLKPEFQRYHGIDSTAASLGERAEACINSLQAGLLSVDVAASFMSCLASQSRIIETTELINRIEKLESKK